MAQTPCIFNREGETIDHTPVAAVTAGDVILIGTVPMIASADIAAGKQGTLACSGIFKVPQKAEIFTEGDAVYWDVDGSPVTGTALTGAATGTASAGNLMGTAVYTSAAADTYVYVKLDAVKRTTTIAGAVTATDITGSDSSLSIDGKAGASGAGGAVAGLGGAGDGAGNAGGAWGFIGGAGGIGGAGEAGGAGGAASLTAGVGGAAGTTGTGGAAGAVNVLGAAGGATATGTGGAGSTVTITAGAGGTASGAGTSGAGGNVVITAGASAAGGGTAGVQGMVRVLSRQSSTVTVTAKTTAATLTIAELLTGFLTGTHTAGATQAYTLPTGTLMSAGCACGDGEGFEWSLVNLSAAAADSITVTAGADHTIVGAPVVISTHVTTGGAITSMGVNSSRWYSRKTTGNTWVTYRVG